MFWEHPHDTQAKQANPKARQTAQGQPHALTTHPNGRGVWGWGSSITPNLAGGRVPPDAGGRGVCGPGSGRHRPEA